MKTSSDKNKSRETLYRDYKNLSSESFNEDLQNILSTTQINTCKQFEDTFLSVLNIHAPSKKKLLRANQSQYLTKALRKAIMRRFKPEKLYIKKQTSESLKAFKKQKNYRIKLCKKESKTITIHVFYPIIRLFLESNKTIFYK